jgi:hypothetical protein
VWLGSIRIHGDLLFYPGKIFFEKTGKLPTLPISLPTAGTDI